MYDFSTKIQQVTVEPGRRMLVVSDIHGNVSYLQHVLEKACFCDRDLLFLVGDIIEKGPDSLGTIQYVMELCQRGNVIPLIGNVDASRLKTTYELTEENAADFYHYLLYMKRWVGTSYYQELAAACGYSIQSPGDVLKAKPAILTRFEDQFRFLAQLPTIVETQSFVFVHGGLREKKVSDNRNWDSWALTKYDAFMTHTPHCFEKYVIVGHWPTALYASDVERLNPVMDHNKRIICIDGGCGTKEEGQLNLLVIPDIHSTADDISYISYDKFPLIRALENQTASQDSLYISWIDRDIRMLEHGEEFSYVQHVRSGRKLYMPNTYLRTDSECDDYTDYILPVQKGDILSLLQETSKGCMVKKQGVVGWYAGAYEKEPG